MKNLLYFGLILIMSSCSIYPSYQFTDNDCDNLYVRIEQDLLQMGKQILEYDYYEELADKLHRKYVKSEDKCKTLSEILSYLDIKLPEYYQYLSETSVYQEYYKLLNK